MDRISDSGSDGCGSIPHGGTERMTCHTWRPSSFCIPPDRPLTGTPGPGRIDTGLWRIRLLKSPVKRFPLPEAINCGTFALVIHIIKVSALRGFR